MNSGINRKLSPKNGTEKGYRKMSQKKGTEKWHRKSSPSILSRQKVMTYRNTSYLKINNKNNNYFVHIHINKTQ